MTLVNLSRQLAENTFDFCNGRQRTDGEHGALLAAFRADTLPVLGKLQHSDSFRQRGRVWTGKPSPTPCASRKKQAGAGVKRRSTL